LACKTNEMAVIKVAWYWYEIRFYLNGWNM